MLSVGMKIITDILGIFPLFWKVYVEQCGLIMRIIFGDVPLEDYNLSKISCFIFKGAEIFILIMTIFGIYCIFNFRKKPQLNKGYSELDELDIFHTTVSYTSLIQDSQKGGLRIDDEEDPPQTQRGEAELRPVMPSIRFSANRNWQDLRPTFKWDDRNFRVDSKSVKDDEDSPIMQPGGLAYQSAEDDRIIRFAVEQSATATDYPTPKLGKNLTPTNSRIWKPTSSLKYPIWNTDLRDAQAMSLEDEEDSPPIQRGGAVLQAAADYPKRRNWKDLHNTSLIYPIQDRDLHAQDMSEDDSRIAPPLARLNAGLNARYEYQSAGTETLRQRFVPLNTDQNASDSDESE